MNGPPPLVSVVVPNFNHARFLPRRLESIFSQTVSGLEIIILDDASTDDSREVIARYRNEPRVQFHANAVNSGSPFAQWNRGVALARSDLVWIAESDDYAAPGLLFALVGLLQAHPNVGLAYCQSWRIDAEDRRLEGVGETFADLDPAPWREAYVRDGRDECRRHLLWDSTIPNASAVVFRRTTYQRAGGAPENMRLAGDWMTWARLLTISDIAFTPERLNYFRHHTATARAHHGGDVFFDERFLIQRFLIGAGVAGAADRRRIAALTVNEFYSRLQSAPAGGKAARARADWRKFKAVLGRAPFRMAAEGIRRARHWLGRRAAIRSAQP